MPHRFPILFASCAVAVTACAPAIGAPSEGWSDSPPPPATLPPGVTVPDAEVLTVPTTVARAADLDDAVLVAEALDLLGAAEHDSRVTVVHEEVIDRTDAPQFRFGPRPIGVGVLTPDGVHADAELPGIDGTPAPVEVVALGHEVAVVCEFVYGDSTPRHTEIDQPTAPLPRHLLSVAPERLDEVRRSLRETPGSWTIDDQGRYRLPLDGDITRMGGTIIARTGVVAIVGGDYDYRGEVWIDRNAGELGIRFDERFVGTRRTYAHSLTREITFREVGAGHEVTMPTDTVPMPLVDVFRTAWLGG